MRKYLNMFRILYLILLLFVLVNFILSFYGYAFTPLLWNPWLYLGAVTALVTSGIASIENMLQIGRISLVFF